MATQKGTGNNVIGVILAAGLGSRLAPFTDATPKCLVKVAGYPIIDFQIKAFLSAGIEKIVIIAGYQSAKIERHVHEHPTADITIIRNLDFETTNNMFSLFQAASELAGRPFILINSDVVIGEAIVQSLVESPYPNAIAVDTSRFMDESMKITLKSGRVNSISKTIASGESAGVSIDLYKFSADGSSEMFSIMAEIINEDKLVSQWTEVALDRLLKDRSVSFFPVDISEFPWWEVDDEKDLLVAEMLFSKDVDSLRSATRFVIDIDGTLMKDGKPLEGALDFLQLLARRNLDFVLVTNNTSTSSESVFAEISSFFPVLQKCHLRTAHDALLEYLAEQKIKSLYCVATKSVKDSLRKEGFDVDSVSPDLVVIAYDKELTYKKLEGACKFINLGTPFISTHPDISYPSGGGPIPDAGAIMNLVTQVTGIEARAVLGKPSIYMVPPAYRENDGTGVVVIGDRLSTDGSLATNLGASFILVWSGATARQDLDSESVWPQACFPSVADIRHNYSPEAL